MQKFSKNAKSFQKCKNFPIKPNFSKIQKCNFPKKRKDKVIVNLSHYILDIFQSMARTKNVCRTKAPQTVPAMVPAAKKVDKDKSAKKDAYTSRQTEAQAAHPHFVGPKECMLCDKRLYTVVNWHEHLLSATHAKKARNAEKPNYGLVEEVLGTGVALISSIAVPQAVVPPSVLAEPSAAVSSTAVSNAPTESNSIARQLLLIPDSKCLFLLVF